MQEADMKPFALAVLTHEIKQPVTAILSNAQAAFRFLTLDIPDLREVRAALADIIADARRTDEVLRRLHAFVTTGAQELTRLDINDVVRETIELVGSAAATQGVTITMVLADDLPLADGDYLQLCQVLLNLIRNAFEAMAEVEEESRILVVRTLSTTPGIVTVEVQDNGPGIDQMTLAGMFHPSFTTKAGGMVWASPCAAPLSRHTGVGYRPHRIRIVGSRCRSLYGEGCAALERTRCVAIQPPK
jgi:two-component system, LuxR family, sensor kinase FixL